MSFSCDTPIWMRRNEEVMRMKKRQKRKKHRDVRILVTYPSRTLLRG